MKRKKTDTVQLSKIRIREELRARLAKDAEKNARTLNGEIAARLEGSYEVAERTALFAEQLEKRIEDMRQNADERAAEARASRDEAKAIADAAKRDLEQAMQESQKEFEEIERKLERATTALQVVDALLGGDKQKSELLRQIVVEMASWPEGWATNQSLGSGLRERFVNTMAGRKAGDAR
jgi:hypothetical protein